MGLGTGRLDQSDRSDDLEGTRVIDMTRLAAVISPPERRTKTSPISTRWESRSARFAAWPISSITRGRKPYSQLRRHLRFPERETRFGPAAFGLPAIERDAGHQPPILGEHTEEVLQLLSRSIEDYRQIKEDGVVWRDTLLPQSSNQCLTPFPFNKRP